MKQPLLIDADKSVIESATSWLARGKWRIECDCNETELLILNSQFSSASMPQEFETEGTFICVTVMKRGPKDRINIFAVRC